MDPEKCSSIALHLTIALMLNYSVGCRDTFLFCSENLQFMVVNKASVSQDRNSYNGKPAHLKSITEKYWSVKGVYRAVFSQFCY